MPKALSRRFFSRPTLEVAPDLIGCILAVDGISGRIVEVEAYTDDPASHGHRRTARSEIMHTTYGYIYVYLSYGANFCANITADQNHVGAILIRALEPLTGIEIMSRRRGADKLTSLCSGPGKLCEALGIDLSFNWTAVGDRVKLYHGKSGEIISTPRIGISRATDLHWRFIEDGNPYLSRRS